MEANQEQQAPEQNQTPDTPEVPEFEKALDTQESSNDAFNEMLGLPTQQEEVSEQAPETQETPQEAVPQQDFSAN